MKTIKTKVGRPNGQRINGEVFVRILSLNEIKFSTRGEHDSERTVLTVNGVDYDGLSHHTKKYPAGQRNCYPWDEEAGWFGHDRAGHMFSYPRELTSKAREMLEPFFRELSEKIEAKNPELFIEAEIEQQQSMIENSKEKIVELRMEINEELANIDNTTSKTEALRTELARIEKEG